MGVLAPGGQNPLRQHYQNHSDHSFLWSSREQPPRFMLALALGWAGSVASGAIGAWLSRPSSAPLRHCICDYRAADAVTLATAQVLEKQLDRCGPEQLGPTPPRPVEFVQRQDLVAGTVGVILGWCLAFLTLVVCRHRHRGSPATALASTSPSFAPLGDTGKGKRVFGGKGVVVGSILHGSQNLVHTSWQ